MPLLSRMRFARGCLLDTVAVVNFGAVEDVGRPIASVPSLPGIRLYVGLHWGHGDRIGTTRHYGAWGNNSFNLTYHDGIPFRPTLCSL